MANRYRVVHLPSGKRAEVTAPDMRTACLNAGFPISECFVSLEGYSKI